MELLEIQRQAMLMYTSCGWFFSEISGIETVQIMKYAARAMQLAASFTDEDFEKAQNIPTSNTQLYKQAGNSIVVDMMIKILEEILKVEDFK